MDRLTEERRSWLMSRVKSKDTTPEKAVRSIVHGLGFRYALHAKDLPGAPDLVLRSRRRLIFVHGCFWHGHEGCTKARLPKSNIRFWKAKLVANRLRDAKVRAVLLQDGWQILTVWQCELTKLQKLERRIARFLRASRGR